MNDQSNQYLNKAKVIVRDVYSDLGHTGYNITTDDLYIVWFSKTLGNWKAMVASKFPDKLYFEVTYNGERKETYVDAYKKVKNVCVPD